MARTIEAIKKEMTDAWMQDPDLQLAYGFNEGDEFSAVFSKASLENLICYIMAVAVWTHEKLFDLHRQEVDDCIAQMKPHTLQWYVNKAKAFRTGQALVDGTDTYDDTGLTEADITAMQPVKFAAATEQEATIFIKVATEADGARSTLPADQVQALKAYMAEVKDAGVRVDIINLPPVFLKIDMDVYYNPMILNQHGERLDGGGKPVEEAITAYIENLPFNGEYRNATLIDKVQAVEGVVIPQLNAASQSTSGAANDYEDIIVRAIPASGYYKCDQDNLHINYIAYSGNE